jgi:hypothetical protein
LASAGYFIGTVWWIYNTMFHYVLCKRQNKRFDVLYSYGLKNACFFKKENNLELILTAVFCFVGVAIEVIAGYDNIIESDPRYVIGASNIQHASMYSLFGLFYLVELLRIYGERLIY